MVVRLCPCYCRIFQGIYQYSVELLISSESRTVSARMGCERSYILADGHFCSQERISRLACVLSACRCVKLLHAIFFLVFTVNSISWL